MNNTNKTYSVWIGGCQEHNNCTYYQAITILNEYINDGYDDALIELETKQWKT
jgi:hypothetical protein